jgi:hypothetical protein
MRCVAFGRTIRRARMRSSLSSELSMDSSSMGSILFGFGCIKVG